MEWKQHMETYIFFYKGYELREYMPTRWVSSNVAGLSYDTAVYQAFMRLFGYISGENEKSKCTFLPWNLQTNKKIHVR